jgi:hypothetical protein
MKTTIIIAFAGIIGLLGLNGCKPRPNTTITGQVFIVTRGDQNIKLGLVEVDLIPQQQTYDFLKTKQTAVETEIAARENEFIASSNALKRVEANLADYEADNPSTTSKYKSMLDNYETNSNAGIRIALKYQLNEVDKNVGAVKSILEQKVADVQMRLDAATTSLTNYPDGDAYFSGFSPSIIQKTLTDADGKFSLAYSAGTNLALYAKADRLVGTRTEKYYWLINAPTNAEATQVFLSNQNFINLDPDGYFKIKPVGGVSRDEVGH